MITDKPYNEIMSLLKGASDEVRSKAPDMHDSWTPFVPYIPGDVVLYSGKLYRCLTAHTSEDTWVPDVSPSLWVRIMFRDGIRVIPETLTAPDAFARDETGWWGDELYRSLIDGNVWTPAAYPAGWELIKMDIIEGDELQ